MAEEQVQTAHDHDAGDRQHGEDGHERDTVTIYVNATPKEVEEDELSYQDVVMLAYDGNPPTGPNWSITVAYSRGPVQNPHGTLTPGHSVKIKEGMSFRVRATDRS